MFEKIDSLDKQILLFFHQNGITQPQFIWYFFSQKYLWFLFGFIVLYRIFNYKFPKILLILLIFGICILLTDRISSGFFKPFFERLRPCHQENLKPFLVLYNNHCGGKFGFISSHAANIWGWVTLYLQIFKTYQIEKIVWLFIASMIALSRMMLGVHFLSDLLIGALIGFLIGYLIGKNVQRFNVLK